jgi:PAS domain S-box-containing protein
MGPRVATVVVADDAPEVRALVRASLRAGGSFLVVGEAANGDEAVALARDRRPSLLLLDASMPVVDGLQALPLVLEVSPDTKVVMYSGFEEQGLAQAALALGAAGFIPKSAPIDTLTHRLMAVLEEAHPAAEALVGQVATVSGDGRSSVLPAATQHQLDEHLERFREVFDQAAIGMATMTLTGRLVRVNQALAELVGHHPADLVGASYGDLTNGHEHLVVTALDKINSRTQDVAELEHGLNGTSNERRVRATIAPVRDASGRALYLFLQAQDVTAERVEDHLGRRVEHHRRQREPVRSQLLHVRGGHQPRLFSQHRRVWEERGRMPVLSHAEQDQVEDGSRESGVGSR